MYLKSIKAFGFKSFADKTQIDLKEGITIIVGPNGSGKSNVVDAIKWVLGEQSIKALRGNTGMADVIFSGSKSRSPHNYASVTLIFDNSDNYLNTEYSEVEVKRICYQTGENEYYLNNHQVRLKDITELFVDSGAGRESFNIISQGKVSDIINQKPEERRTIIEDAAGVVKYKKRKEETLRKLDKTKDNLERINLIINELEINLEPLKNQSEIAKKYLESKSELESIEIALIAFDIRQISQDYDSLKDDVKSLQDQSLSEETSINSLEQKIETIKAKILKIDEKISQTNKNVLDLTEKLTKIEAKKQLTKERQKYNSEDSKVQANLVELKEIELNLKNSMTILKKELEDLELSLETKEKKQAELSLEIKKNTSIKNTLNNEINSINKREMSLKNTRDILEENINNDAKMPYAVKNVLNNPRLEGIHGVLGRLIDTESIYSTAIEISLGYNSNVVIIDNEEKTKEAIKYLKDNGLGRVTFFPLNIIKPKGIDPETLLIIENHPGYVGIAGNLVKYDSLYRNVVLNQLGNTVIVNNIDAMNELGRKINYRYRIITLDGELLHTGGSVTGGSSKSSKGLVSERFELERIIRELNNVSNELKNSENQLKTIDQELKILNENYDNITKEMVSTSELLNRKKYSLAEQNNRYQEIIFELKGNKAVLSNEIDQELALVLEEYSQLVSQKEILEVNLSNFEIEKDNLNNELNTLESNRKQKNSDFNFKQKELHEKEIIIGRMETKLDSLLGILNEEYNLTYEKAYETHQLELEEKIARMKVQTLKMEIKAMGEVNTGSISEFERIDKRYNFLTKQRDDLIGGINNLNEIIESLDETMKEKLIITFEQVNQEFEKVFKELFKGGKGFLSLTNPNDILETGIEINAEPPGKNLKLISLLSGGEMTLTAIALLFSILNIRPVPFCVLDEVEANLDEVNVDMFGKYIKHYQGKTQFIIITHKKKTMEFADSLYGITMQESGVSKLVSVKLDSISR